MKINLSNIKKCRKCKHEKTLTEFFVDNRASDGRTSKCRICQQKQRKSSYRLRKKTIRQSELEEKIRQYANFTIDTFDEKKFFSGSDLLTIFKLCLNDLETHTTNA